MQNLADVVLDYLWLLHFAEEDSFNPDDAINLAEGLVHQIENDFTDAERQALSEAADRRLKSWLAEPDEDAYTPRQRLTREQKVVLEDIAAGRFDTPRLDELEETGL
jgi:hypothetical protein